MTERPPMARSLLLLAAGFALWAGAFVALYGMLSVGCAFGWDAIELAPGITLQRLQLVLLLAAFLAAHAALLHVLRSGSRGVAGAGTGAFVRSTASLGAAAAFAASGFTFIGVFALDACV